MKDYLELLNIINRIDGRVDQLIRHAAAQKYSEENSNEEDNVLK